MVIAGTGHRPNKLGGYSIEAFNELVRVADEFLKGNPQITHVISGMALGWDQALAHAALDNNKKVLAAIPCKDQPKAWPASSRDDYQNLISRIKHAGGMIQVLQESYDDACMQKRNIWMVDRCHTLLAMYNGTPGGTANCIKYAESLKIPIINLFEKLNTDVWTPIKK